MFKESRGSVVVPVEMTFLCVLLSCKKVLCKVRPPATVTPTIEIRLHSLSTTGRFSLVLSMGGVLPIIILEVILLRRGVLLESVLLKIIGTLVLPLEVPPTM